MSTVSSNYDHIVKLILVGDSGVGKSCILLRFCDDEFSPSFIATIGLDHKSKVIYLDNGKKVKIQVWDTAGQEQYKTMTSNFYRSTMGIGIVYDVTYRRSFMNVPNWLKNVEEHASENVVKILIGNKCDMEDQRVVSYMEGAELAKANGMAFLETSAKSDINVDALFIKLSKSALDKIKDVKSQPESNDDQKISLFTITREDIYKKLRCW